jgi:dihydroneopterin aldolase
MTSKIELKGMKFYAYHGVSAQERQVGNIFVVNLLLTAPLEDAIESDELRFTINYASVYEIVKVEMDIPSNLLENAAGRIINSLKSKFLILTQVEIKLTKLNPPFGGDLQSASVILDKKF